jgi:NAD(P)-dependent dehydrogenase (short-subunit alcohol dehydrogenase family)
MTEQRIAIVTGGNAGIGLAVARKFSEAQVLTYITGRDKHKLEYARKSLGPNVRSVICDSADRCAIIAFVEDVVNAHGHIDILINNAAVNLKKHLLETTDDEFSEILRTNVSGLFTMSREVGRVMAQQKHGSIIHISSMAAHYGIPKVVAYAASKSAVEGMTRAMAADLSPLGVRVNCIAPGFIATDMTSKAFNDDDERKRKVLARTPLGKMGDPDDVASAAFFLASDEAKFITGEILKVDGGNSIGF